MFQVHEGSYEFERGKIIGDQVGERDEIFRGVLGVRKIRDLKF